MNVLGQRLSTALRLRTGRSRPKEVPYDGLDLSMLEEVLRDEHFPDVDLALRRGRHIGRDDGTAYDFLVDELDQLEPFYRRVGCELVRRRAATSLASVQ
ncbi:chromosome partition protein MukE [Archangium violaceum]|uniref:chromosome partition protein MukE n=1 Tax=Archangium violaceum TaxID=83451 RepID=UPI002B2AF22C|nr:chromosome partition protein MukE [Archangium gephyra]